MDCQTSQWAAQRWTEKRSWAGVGRRSPCDLVNSTCSLRALPASSNGVGLDTRQTYLSAVDGSTFCEQTLLSASGQQPVSFAIVTDLSFSSYCTGVLTPACSLQLDLASLCEQTVRCLCDTTGFCGWLLDNASTFAEGSTFAQRDQCAVTGDTCSPSDCRVVSLLAGLFQACSHEQTLMPTVSQHLGSLGIEAAHPLYSCTRQVCTATCRMKLNHGALAVGCGC